jgi:hypothetical protein
MLGLNESLGTKQFAPKVGLILPEAQGAVSTHVVASLRDARFLRLGVTQLLEINFRNKTQPNNAIDSRPKTNRRRNRP